MREDWIEIELGKVGKVVSGGTPKTSIPEFWGDEISWISPADLSKYESKYIAKGRRSISKLGLEKSSATLMPANSVLFSSRAPIGYVVIAKNKLATNQGFKSLIPYSIVGSEYLYYFFKSAKNIAEKNASGTTFKELSAKKFSNLSFPLAPLPEQRAIVAKIEQLFSELDNGIANLKAAKDKLEIYRQAVLKKAFEGEWETCTVGNKFKFLGGGTPKKSIPEYWNGDIPWCSVKDVKGDFLYKTKDYITELGLKESSTNIAEIGEVILITRISPGKSIITKIRTAINQDLKIVSPIDDYSPKFTHYLFKSIKREMLKKSNGTTVLGINLNNLKDISIPDIPEEDQNHVIEFIESRLSICENVLANIEEGLNKSEALRQSILKQAFEGKLLSEEEVEACRAAPDWEPAEQLLERIKNQKEGTA